MLNYGLTCRGTIDVGYTGSIQAVLFNHGNECYAIKRGDRITQFVVLPCLIPALMIVDELAESERGNGGFGSTGR